MGSADRVIDADIHNVVPGISALLPYLPEGRREYTAQTAISGPIFAAGSRTVKISAGVVRALR